MEILLERRAIIIKQIRATYPETYSLQIGNAEFQCVSTAAATLESLVSSNDVRNIDDLDISGGYY